ncbi:unnamed protein product, partial [Brenthis ino]
MVALPYILDSYYYIFEELSSPITKGWFLTRKPYLMIGLVTAYYYFCTNLGPRLMKHRKPFHLAKVLLVYNVVQIIVNFYIIIEAIRYVFLSNYYDMRCKGLETDEKIATWVANGMWVYYLLKVSELLDTVFFVLRKSLRQITKLHLHHHMLMVITCWFGTTYYPGGQWVLIGFLNSIVHVIMYFYYLISGLGNRYKKYVWWKKYVTIVQLVQFVLIAIYNINSMFYECSYPFFYKFFGTFYSVFFFTHFAKFYYDTYVNPKPKRKTLNNIKKQ